MKSLAKVLMVLSLAAVICLPTAASANILVDLYEVDVNNSATVNIHADGLGDVDGVLAGNYILGISNPSSSGNPFIQFSGYCVEPAYSSSTPLVYELLPITQGTAFAAAAWILSQGYTSQAQAAQVAVWELTWDTALGKAYDLSADNFRLYSGVNTTDVDTIYAAAMAAGFDPSGYVVAHNPVGSTEWAAAQDYIIPNPVPVPPSLLLLGTGLLGLGCLRRRKVKDGLAA